MYGKLLRKKIFILWIKWVHIVYIQDSDWWMYQPPKSASRGRKNVCKVKDLMRGRYDAANRWLNGGKKYSSKEGYKWLKGQFESV